MGGSGISDPSLVRGAEGGDGEGRPREGEERPCLPGASDGGGGGACSTGPQNSPWDGPVLSMRGGRLRERDVPRSRHVRAGDLGASSDSGSQLQGAEAREG